MNFSQVQFHLTKGIFHRGGYHGKVEQWNRPFLVLKYTPSYGTLIGRRLLTTGRRVLDKDHTAYRSFFQTRFRRNQARCIPGLCSPGNIRIWIYQWSHKIHQNSIFGPKSGWGNGNGFKMLKSLFLGEKEVSVHVGEEEKWKGRHLGKLRPTFNPFIRPPPPNSSKKLGSLLG